MLANFYKVVGFILIKKNYPCFAIPYFMDAKSNCFIQNINKNGIIKKEKINLQDILKQPGIHYFNGVNYKKETFFKEKIYAFAYSKKEFCIDRKENMCKYINNLVNKHKKLLNNEDLSFEIFNFLTSSQNKDVSKSKNEENNLSH